MKCIPLLLFLYSTQNICSQNLLYNGDFETYKHCPINYLSAKRFLPYWHSPTKGTPDYYNKCSRGLAGIPKNFSGKEDSQSGYGYVGIGVVNFSYGYEREYIATKFTSELVRDRLYCITMYVSLADYSKYAISRIEMYFSKKKPDKLTKGILPYHPQVSFEKMYFDNKEGWIMLCDTYKAVGGEKYLVIGNFEDKYPRWPGLHIPGKVDYLESKTLDISGYVNKIPESAYYYIDNVSLIEIRYPNECVCEEYKSPTMDSTIINNEDTTFQNIKPGEIFILQNVYFEFDKSELLPESFPELDKLAAYLIETPDIRIEISGHTDNTGSDEYNLPLSESRAKAVVEYLKNKGIDPARLTHKGYGSSRPIANNTTEEGRSKNRRVELVVVEQ